MIIDACPRFVQTFFGSFRDELSRPQYAHLWTVVLAIAVSWRGSKLCHLAGIILHGRHRTALGDFLRHSDWDAAGVLEDRARWLVKRMKPRPGEVIELIIDDTRIAKRGRKMACLQKIWDHKQQMFVYGHIVVVAAIRVRGVVVPWRIVLWKPKKDARRCYRKLTEIAAEMIELFTPPTGVKVRVLFDAFYLCPLVVGACQHRGFRWFSVAAKNRAFTRDGGRRKSIGQLAPGWIRHWGRNVRMRRTHGFARMRIAKVDGSLSRIGRVRLVVSKRPHDRWKNLIAIVTNETGLDARAIVSVYERRWSIEVLFKELRTSLGFGDYQVMDEQAIVRHLHLCGLAHQLLTHYAMERVGAQARKANVEVALPPMSQRLEALRLDIRRDQLRRIVRGQRYRRLRMRIEPYLLAA